jgi:hypothetical protein
MVSLARCRNFGEIRLGQPTRMPQYRHGHRRITLVGKLLESFWKLKGPTSQEHC